MLFHYFVYSVCIVSSLIRYYFLYIDPIKKKPEIVTRTQKKKKRFEKIGNNELRAEIHFSPKKNRKETNNYSLNPNGILYKVFCFNFFYRSASYTIHIVTLWWIIYETCFSVHSTKTNETIFQSHSNLSSVILYLFETKYPKYDHFTVKNRLRLYPQNKKNPRLYPQIPKNLSLYLQIILRIRIASGCSESSNLPLSDIPSIHGTSFHVMYVMI